MFDQGAFDFEWSDKMTGDVDDIIRSADEMKVSVLVLASTVTGYIPAILET